MRKLRKIGLLILCGVLLLGTTGCENEGIVDNDNTKQEPAYQINLNENISVYQTHHSTLCGGWMFPLNAEEILENKIEMTDAGYPRINVGSIEIAPHEWDEIYFQLTFDTEKENKASEKFKTWSNESYFGVGKFEPTFTNHEFGYTYYTIVLEEPEKYSELNAELEEAIENFEKNIDTIFIQEGAYLHTGPCGGAVSGSEILTEDICEEYHLNCSRW